MCRKKKGKNKLPQSSPLYRAATPIPNPDLAPSLTALPVELLLLIAEAVFGPGPDPDLASLSRLSRTDRCLHRCLDGFLYEMDMNRGNGQSLWTGLTVAEVGLVRKSLAALRGDVDFGWTGPENGTAPRRKRATGTVTVTPNWAKTRYRRDSSSRCGRKLPSSGSPPPEFPLRICLDLPVLSIVELLLDRNASWNEGPDTVPSHPLKMILPGYVYPFMRVGDWNPDMAKFRAGVKGYGAESGDDNRREMSALVSLLVRRFPATDDETLKLHLGACYLVGSADLTRLVVERAAELWDVPMATVWTADRLSFVSDAAKQEIEFGLGQLGFTEGFIGTGGTFSMLQGVDVLRRIAQSPKASMAMVRWALDLGADPRFRSPSGTGALHVIHQWTFKNAHDRMELAAYLLEHNDVNDETSRGKTAISSAARHLDLDMIRLLVARGASINLRTSGYTPMEIAILTGVYMFMSEKGGGSEALTGRVIACIDAMLDGCGPCPQRSLVMLHEVCRAAVRRIVSVSRWTPFIPIPTQAMVDFKLALVRQLLDGDPKMEPKNHRGPDGTMSAFSAACSGAGLPGWYRAIRNKTCDIFEMPAWFEIANLLLDRGWMPSGEDLVVLAEGRTSPQKQLMIERVMALIAGAREDGSTKRALRSGRYV